MASSKGKTRDPPAKKRITRRISHPGTRSRVRLARHKRASIPYRQQPYDSINIPQLVYELLTIDKYNQEAKRFPSPKRFGTRCQRMLKSHEQQRLPYESIDHCDDSESVQVPEYTMECRPTSIDSLIEATDVANSSAPTSSANSSVSNISMGPITLANSLNSAKALFRKRSLVQLINSYIKAGIKEGQMHRTSLARLVYLRQLPCRTHTAVRKSALDDDAKVYECDNECTTDNIHVAGKRQAKKYIRKALSFGVRSGYLIPTDRQGNVFRVCPTLDTRIWSSRRTDIESRRRRRTARRGETRLTTIADRKAMRRGIPQGKSLHNVATERMASKRRYRTQSAQSSVKSLGAKESSPRKSPGKSLRERSKPKALARKNSKNNNTINNKRGQQRKRGDGGDVKKPVKRRRTSSSSKRAENDHKPIEESFKDVSERDRNQYKNNENNYRAITERRKSTSSQEDGLRVEKRKLETNINDDRINCDRVESRKTDDDNNDKRSPASEEASVEYDVSGRTTKEMET